MDFVGCIAIAAAFVLLLRFALAWGASRCRNQPRDACLAAFRRAALLGSVCALVFVPTAASHRVELDASVRARMNFERNRFEFPIELLSEEYAVVRVVCGAVGRRDKAGRARATTLPALQHRRRGVLGLRELVAAGAQFAADGPAGVLTAGGAAASTRSTEI